MKLRIRGNSIRVRLTQGEVVRLEEIGSVEDRIEFGADEAQKLHYRVETSENEESITAYLEPGRITLRVPRAAAAQWATTEEIGLEAEQSLDGEKKLKVLLEKDYACLKPRTGDDDRDAFPHPQENERC